MNRLVLHSERELNPLFNQKNLKGWYAFESETGKHQQGLEVFAVENKIAEPINLGSGEGVTIKIIAETVANYFGKELAWDKDKPSGDPIRLFDMSRANSYGYKSEISIVEGVRNTIDCIVWLKFDKLFFNLESNIYICATYISPEASPVHAIYDIDLFMQLEQDITYFSQFGKLFTRCKLHYGPALHGYNNAEKLCSDARKWIDDELISMQKDWSEVWTES